MMQPEAIVVMTKFPEPGCVKTRLQPALSAEQAASVHRAFLLHFVERLCSLKGAGVNDLVYVCFDPRARAHDFAELLPMIPADRFFPQADGSLGNRIAEAFAHLRANHSAITFFGTDSPDLPWPVLGAWRQSSAAVAIGPATDGGYYMLSLGTHVDAHRLLANIEWSSGRERQQTIEAAVELGYTVLLTQKWEDVDRPDDLRRLIDRLSRSSDSSECELLNALSFVPREKLI